MPKSFQRIRRINENIWFKQQQKLLLWMVNTDYGRDLLCIPKHYEKIISIAKNYVSFRIGEYEFITDFRVGSKWANVIRYRWGAFQEYAQEYYQLKGFWLPILFPVTMPLGMKVAYVDSTFFPDPGTGGGNTSVDGRAFITGANSTFADIRANAGTGFSDTGTLDEAALYTATTTTNQYSTAVRGIYIFDTASLPDANTITAATLSFVSQGGGNSTGLGNMLCNIVQYTGTATNALGSADYNIANHASTKFTTSFSITSWTADDVTYNNLTLNASGQSNISKTGLSKFSFRFDDDIDNTTDELVWSSGATSGIKTYFADQAGTGKDPKLLVTHSAAAGMNLLPLLGIG